jgi:hypothetical protein
VFNRKQKEIDKLTVAVEHLEGLIGEYIDLAFPERHRSILTLRSEVFRAIIREMKADRKEKERKAQLKRDVNEILDARERKNRLLNGYAYRYTYVGPAVASINTGDTNPEKEARTEEK